MGGISGTQGRLHSDLSQRTQALPRGMLTSWNLFQRGQPDRSGDDHIQATCSSVCSNPEGPPYGRKDLGSSVRVQRAGQRTVCVHCSVWMTGG